MTKKFPCPYCKGQGGKKEIILHDEGTGIFYPCGCCKGAGMVEIGGPIHQRLKDIKAGIDPDAAQQQPETGEGSRA